MANLTPEITMADLEGQCRDRLEYASQVGEAVVRTVKTFNPDVPSFEATTFETTTGVIITSFYDQIRVVCDFSELGYDAPQSVLTIDFNPPGTAPEATDVITTDEGITSKTTPLNKHNALAADISRLVALEI